MSDSEQLPCLRIKGEWEGMVKRIQIARFPFTIGREPNNDLQLSNGAVSRFHAEIRRTPEGRCLLIDTGSKHGTWINGTRITEHVLADGDEIILAYHPPTVLRFELAPGSEDGNSPHPEGRPPESSPLSKKSSRK